MAKIRLDIESLNRSETALAQKIDELNALILRTEALTNRIADSWDGEASEAYVLMIRQYIAKAQKLKEVLVEFKGYVASASDKFSSLDHQCAARIRNT